ARRLTASHVSFPEGQGGLQTTRLTATYEASIPPGQVALAYVDGNFAERLGWREIVVLPGTGTQLTGDFPTRDVSQALTSYPGDKIASPLDTTSVTFSFDAAGATTAPALSDIPITATAPSQSGTALVSLMNTTNI